MRSHPLAIDYIKKVQYIYIYIYIYIYMYVYMYVYYN